MHTLILTTQDVTLIQDALASYSLACAEAALSGELGKDSELAEHDATRALELSRAVRFATGVAGPAEA